MNEQTKAIGRQAGLVFIEDGVYGQRWYSSRCGLDTSEYEKLVELIARECVSVILSDAKTIADAMPTANRDNYTTVAEHTGMINVSMRYADKIREHFGVQE